MKILKKALFGAFFVFLLLGISGQRAMTQDLTPDDYYGGVETTSYAVYDPDIGEFVEIRFRYLPWWWGPLYLPPGWVLLTAAIAPVVWYEATCAQGAITFSHVRFHHGHGHLRRHHAHFGHFRGHLHGKFRHHFHQGKTAAHKKFPGLKRPPGFQHAGHPSKGHPGFKKPGDQRGGKQVHPPGKGAPPSVHSSPTAKHPGSPEGARGPKAAGAPSVRPPQGSAPAQPQTKRPGEVRSPRTGSNTQPKQAPSAGARPPNKSPGGQQTVRPPKGPAGGPSPMMGGGRPQTRGPGPQQGVMGMQAAPRGGPAPSAPVFRGGRGGAPRGNSVGGNAPRGGGGSAPRGSGGSGRKQGK